MRHHRLLVHLVWTTRDREPLITLRLAEFLSDFLPPVAMQERATLLAMGLVSTHVHLLLRLNPETSIPRLIQRLKGGSSVMADKEGHNDDRLLRWAKGYSITTIGEKAVPRVIGYLRHQNVRHPQEVIVGWNNNGRVRG